MQDQSDLEAKSAITIGMHVREDVAIVMKVEMWGRGKRLIEMKVEI